MFFQHITCFVLVDGVSTHWVIVSTVFISISRLYLHEAEHIHLRVLLSVWLSISINLDQVTLQWKTVLLSLFLLFGNNNDFSCFTDSLSFESCNFMRQARQGHWSHLIGKKAETQISDFTYRSQKVNQWPNMDQNPGPLLPAWALYQSRCHHHGPSPCDLSAELITQYTVHSCYLSPSPRSISKSLSRFNGVSLLKLKIIAPELYCWYYNGSLLNVHTSTRPTWKYIQVNVIWRKDFWPMGVGSL